MTKQLDMRLDLFAEQARAKAATLQSARQRQMIDAYIRHTTAEIAGELEPVMATMCAEPRFHVWHNGAEIGAKGQAEVREMYTRMFETCSNFFQLDIQRIVIDDHCFVKEYIQTNILPGTNFVTGPRAAMARDLGEEPDPDAHYMTQGRVLVMIPFDEDCLMLGEDSFTGGGSTVRKLADEELPDSYRQRLGI